MTNISEKTLVPIGFAALVIGGGMAWATAMQISVNAQANEISSLKSDNKKVLESLARIEGRLGIQQPEMGRK